MPVLANLLEQVTLGRPDSRSSFGFQSTARALVSSLSGAAWDCFQTPCPMSSSSPEWAFLTGRMRDCPVSHRQGHFYMRTAFTRQPVPQEFLRFVGDHPAHPGSGKGPKPRSPK